MKHIFICLLITGIVYGQDSTCPWTASNVCGPIGSVAIYHATPNYQETGIPSVQMYISSVDGQECGAIYFLPMMNGSLPDDVCPDANGRIVKYLPLESVPDITHLMESEQISSVLYWYPTGSGFAFANLASNIKNAGRHAKVHS